VEGRWLFVDIEADGEEMTLNLRDDARVGVRFGIQPNATASIGRGRKIQQ